MKRWDVEKTAKHYYCINYNSVLEDCIMALLQKGYEAGPREEYWKWRLLVHIWIVYRTLFILAVMINQTSTEPLMYYTIRNHMYWRYDLVIKYIFKMLTETTYVLF